MASATGAKIWLRAMSTVGKHVLSMHAQDSGGATSLWPQPEAVTKKGPRGPCWGCYAYFVRTNRWCADAGQMSTMFQYCRDMVAGELLLR